MFILSTTTAMSSIQWGSSFPPSSSVSFTYLLLCWLSASSCAGSLGLYVQERDKYLFWRRNLKKGNFYCASKCLVQSFLPSYFFLSIITGANYAIPTITQCVLYPLQVLWMKSMVDFLKKKLIFQWRHTMRLGFLELWIFLTFRVLKISMDPVHPG